MPVVRNYAPHALVTFGGTLGSAPSSDIWQCGVRVSESPVLADVELSMVSNPLSDPVAYMNWLAPNLKTWFGTGTWASVSGVGMHPAAKLEWLKVNNISATGHYATPAAPHRFDYSPSQAGTANVGISLPAPWYCTPAASWRTNRKSRGRASHGRVFLPWALPGGSIPVMSTGASNSTAGQILACAVDLIHRLNTDGNGVYPHPVKAIIASGIDGTWSQIDYVKVGNVYDVQRRRKNAIPETYQALTV